MNSAEKIRRALQQSVSRFQFHPPTFSAHELDGIRHIFRMIREEYPLPGYDGDKQRILAALLEISPIYEHLALGSLVDRGNFEPICRDLVDEGLPVKFYEVAAYGRCGFERNALVLELM
ncbi:hypothetical protein PTW32_15980 [Dechloromonas agitata]|uniref:hypothetical protein n=1 Tax=Dechloromonas agitata TaxID=73030 RepID=UPI00237E7C81|nr:hypothetical protein [Dechloromonas agitata]MDE1546916.1 hypothetical protein [Dechloromonas agitata]